MKSTILMTKVIGFLLALQVFISAAVMISDQFEFDFIWMLALIISFISFIFSALKAIYEVKDQEAKDERRRIKNI